MKSIQSLFGQLRLIASLSVALVVGAATESFAVPITVPTGLNLGDEYRLAFVTSSGTNATSSDIATYNTFVTNVANTVTELAALGTIWTVIGSTATVDARDNTSTNPGVETGVPIYLLNDTLLANNNADLWDGSIGVGLSITETGSAAVNAFSFTGTDSNGTALSPLGGGTSVRVGRPTFTTSVWVSFAGETSTASRTLYAVSDVITVVPEPGTGLLLSVGLLGLGAHRRRTKA